MTKVMKKPWNEGSRSAKQETEKLLKQVVEDPANPDLAVNHPEVVWPDFSEPMDPNAVAAVKKQLGKKGLASLLGDDGLPDMDAAKVMANELFDKHLKEASGGVWVNNLRIPKLKSVTMDRFGHVDIEGTRRHLNLPGLDDVAKERELSLYCVLNRGKKHYYLLDDRSSVKVHIGEGDMNLIQDYNDPDPILLLINSHSQEDSVVGDSVLINVKSDYCVFNQSVVHWKEDAPGVWDKHDKAFAVLSSVSLKKMKVVNTRLPGGCYSEGTIRNCRFVCPNPGMVDVYKSNLYNSIVSAFEISISQSTLSDLDIVCDGSLKVYNTNFRYARRIRSPGQVYIPNKFSVLEIETLNTPMTIVRESEDLLVITNPWREKEALKFNKNVSRSELRELLMQTDKFGLKVDDGDMLAYVVDTIYGRLRVIRLLDQAALITQLASNERGYVPLPSFYKY